MDTNVTPFVGVWIETERFREDSERERESHPSWVCGLKHQSHMAPYTEDGSHPSWVCGLKLNANKMPLRSHESHPSWVCGLKQY